MDKGPEGLERRVISHPSTPPFVTLPSFVWQAANSVWEDGREEGTTHSRWGQGGDTHLVQSGYLSTHERSRWGSGMPKTEPQLRQALSKCSSTGCDWWMDNSDAAEVPGLTRLLDPGPGHLMPVLALSGIHCGGREVDVSTLTLGERKSEGTKVTRPALPLCQSPAPS